jgi:mannose-6-phosphate isomerase-like protein (cupin superfamily)
VKVVKIAGSCVVVLALIAAVSTIISPRVDAQGGPGTQGGRGRIGGPNTPAPPAGPSTAWSTYGGNLASHRYSPANYQRPQPGNKGHYHEEGGEFWLIMLGTIRYNIEGLQEFEAQEGDVVYVPRQTWHLASFGGKEGLRSCRLAMNGFPYQAHMFEQD